MNKKAPQLGQTAAEPRTTNRPLVLASVMLGMFMGAIEATIVATAMPSIVGDLGGFSLFSWVFSVFLLMQAVTIPIYGKLADLFGRKPVFTFGVIVFLVGSILCGLSGSMKLLIIYRIIQGIGAGAIQPIAMTIVGDIYSIEERGKIQGYLASVWGISSVIGPTIGGIFVEYVNWAWVFWVNIPIGILAIAGLLLYLHEKVEKKKHDIDYLGSALLFLSISALMISLVLGGVAWPWFSTPILLLMGLFVVSIAAFIVQERRAKEPMMPFSLWKHPLIAVCNVASLTTGALMIGVSTFLPTFVQGVMERSPTTAGFVLAAMSIGWPLASTFGGRYMMRIGFRPTAIAGGVVLIIGSMMFTLLKPEQGPLLAAIASFLIGVGMGLSTTTFIVAVQGSVDWKSRGIATASNMFMRILGTTIGAALLGSVLNSRLHHYMAGKQADIDYNLDISLTNELMDPVKRSMLPSDVVQVAQDGLTIGLHTVYIGVVILAVVSFVLILLLPKPGKKAEPVVASDPAPAKG